MTTEDFTVRRAGLGDASLLARLGAELFADAFAAQNTPEDMAAYLSAAFSDTQQSRELSDARNMFFVAESAAGEAIGYAQLCFPSHTPARAFDRPAELSRLYSDRRWHGRAVGARLLQACVDAASQRGATDLWLGVWQENPRAVAFYRKHGFEIVGEKTFVVGSDPQIDWVMSRGLDAMPDLPAHWIPGKPETWTTPYRPYGDYDHQSLPTGAAIHVQFPEGADRSSLAQLVADARDHGHPIHDAGFLDVPSWRTLHAMIILDHGRSYDDIHALTVWLESRPGVEVVGIPRRGDEEDYI
jgi:ribosomal protein S18 acetylase RimI-like enzyme